MAQQEMDGIQEMKSLQLTAEIWRCLAITFMFDTKPDRYRYSYTHGKVIEDIAFDFGKFETLQATYHSLLEEKVAAREFKACVDHDIAKFVHSISTSQNSDETWPEGQVSSEIVGEKRKRPPISHGSSFPAQSASLPVDLYSQHGASSSSSSSSSSSFSSSGGTAAIAAALKEAKGRVRATGSSRTTWTEEMDERLREAFELYGKDGQGKWRTIASHVGFGVHRKQCQLRWQYYVNPEQNSNKKSVWTPEEDSRLRELAESAERYIAEKTAEDDLTPPSPSKGLCVSMRGRKLMIDWKSISMAMGGVAIQSCTNRWNDNLRVAHLKRGGFTEEEDEIIVKRKAEWDASGKGNGLWSVLEKELGRSSNNIRSRWKQMSPKQLQALAKSFSDTT